MGGKREAMNCRGKILLCLGALLLLILAASRQPGPGSWPVLAAAEKHTHGQGGEECQECNESSGASGHHHHRKTHPEGAGELPKVHSGLDHGEHAEDCQTCREYFGEPWRSPKKFSSWMRHYTGKMLLFILLCYLYLKRKSFLNLFSRKEKR